MLITMNTLEEALNEMRKRLRLDLEKMDREKQDLASLQSANETDQLHRHLTLSLTCLDLC